MTSTKYYRMIKNKYNEDTGIRITKQGKLYIDKKVFYSRTDVINRIKSFLGNKTKNKKCTKKFVH